MSTATAARTDIHRPSAPEFDPEAYTCLGTFELGRVGAKARTIALAAATADGHTFAPSQRGRQCGHCGAHLTYAALMLHRNGDLIWVGETCLDGRFAGTRADFDRLRQDSKAVREAEKRAALFVVHLVDAVTRSPVLEVLGNTDAMANELAYSLEFASSVREQLHRKPASEKQVTALAAAIEKDRAHQAARAEEETGPRIPVPVGQQDVAGVVQSVKPAPGYSYDSPDVMKMLVVDERGFRVYGTIPASLLRMAEGATNLVGRIVEFSAVLKASNGDDESFGFFSQPKDPALVSVVAG